jgi:hypothetical protein
MIIHRHNRKPFRTEYASHNWRGDDSSCFWTLCFPSNLWQTQILTNSLWQQRRQTRETVNIIRIISIRMHLDSLWSKLEAEYHFISQQTCPFPFLSAYQTSFCTEYSFVFGKSRVRISDRKSAVLWVSSVLPGEWLQYFSFATPPFRGMALPS